MSLLLENMRIIFLSTLGDIGIFSLDFGKFITTGEGSLILTNNRNYFKYCKAYHDHGHENNPKYSRGMDTKSFSLKYRMTEMQGVIERTIKKSIMFKRKQKSIKSLKVV